MSLGALAALAPAAYQRLQLSRAKHRSLAGHSRMAKRLARLLPGYHFDDQMFFKCDNAPFDIQNARRHAFFKLAEVLKARHPLSIQATAAARENISDMQFISAYRVPFQFSP
jgi:glutamate-1-semialdehyde 2,1-aminomutase